MWRFLSRTTSLERVLVIESGERDVTERLLESLYDLQCVQVDLLTCYSSEPATFRTDQGRSYSVHDPEIRANRGQFIRQLCSGPYTALPILCTGSGVLQKWKWMIGFRSSAKIVLVNKQSSFFVLDLWHGKALLHFVRQRIPVWLLNPAEMLVVPFTVLYLVTYTFIVHLRASLRRSYRRIERI